MDGETQSAADSEVFNFRTPEVTDGKTVYDLIKASPPLDLNSLYSYLLLCAHFDRESVIAEMDGEICGYISAYIHPKQEDTLFIWQVAVHPKARKKGLASRMIFNILERPQCRNVTFIETTVTPSNTASAALFRNTAKKLGTGCKETEYFSEHLFGEEAHEPEMLFRIGPFSK